MVLSHLTSDALDGLCNEDQLKLLDAIDSLRSQGISHYISLPQIIVCGDQSSGKSSVLEAISGVSFPVKSNLCTRFPTELILRKASTTAIKVSIVPHHSRTDEEKTALSGFHGTLDAFQELPTLMENAKAAMGIMTLGKAFSKDLLRIEISGPSRPHLTIVDLPGLIHSETKHQSASDIGLIKDVVESYMLEPRSIILAVVSAKNDYANQIVLKLAQEADPSGTRTLGVITKPDTLSPGSESEHMYLSLARNQDVEFQLGWHVLRNRDTDVDKWSLDKRDAQEAQFFSRGSWALLPPTNLGIKALRARLSKLLLYQIASELPNLVTEITTKAADCQLHLDKIGQPRSDASAQRIFLIQLSQKFQTLLQHATDGNYENPFFGDLMTKNGYERRIRAVIQNMCREFAKDMEENGQDQKIGNESTSESKKGKRTTREKFIEEIIEMMDRSRGRELPGTFSPMIVVGLFKKQSSPWESITQAHILKSWEAVKTFLVQLIADIADAPTSKALDLEVIDPKLDVILNNLRTAASDLLQPHQLGHPITCEPSFAELLHKVRLENLRSKFKIIVENKVSSGELHYNRTVDVDGLCDALMKTMEFDMSHRAASESLDCLEAYYKVALKRFVDDIAVQVIENCLVSKLADIFSPITVAMMSDDELNRIAGETEQNRALRADLEKKLKLLEKGAATCQTYANFQVSASTKEAIVPLL